MRSMFVASFLTLAFSLAAPLPAESAEPNPKPPPSKDAPAQKSVGSENRALSRAEVGAPANSRCLPIVGCGFAYSCAIGWPDSNESKTFQIRHPVWNDGQSKLLGVVGRHCVANQCTEAFVKAFMCTIIGTSSPAADATCHFSGDRCVGASTIPTE